MIKLLQLLAYQIGNEISLSELAKTLEIDKKTVSNYIDILDIRPDLGGLWENLCIIERLKAQGFAGNFVNNYFWRNYAKQEIDFIEESQAKFNLFEFKWKSAIAKVPQEFLENSQASISRFKSKTRTNSSN